jgi:hypothetical protein
LSRGGVGLIFGIGSEYWLQHQFTIGPAPKTNRIPAVRKSGIRGAIRKVGPLGKKNGIGLSDGARMPGGLIKRPGLELELRPTKKADVSKINFP